MCSPPEITGAAQSPDPDVGPVHASAPPVRRNYCSVTIDFDVFWGNAAVVRTNRVPLHPADVDGFARTWDAWAWKMMKAAAQCGGVNLGELFFNSLRSLAALCPGRQRCSDLGTKLAWCRANERECGRSPTGRGRMPEVVYSAAEVARRLRARTLNAVCTELREVDAAPVGRATSMTLVGSAAPLRL